ncbi:MAG: GNAT family N-acetyltransferase [Rhodospirillaceae bacterium]|nr:GNAT family N-acetyltransferase [Rhodospirillaceae bacterium]
MSPPKICIEPLDPSKHNREAFSCGTDRLDNFLKKTARKQQAGDFTRLWVATYVGQTEIIGYYAINAHYLEGDDLPTGLTRNAPRTGGIPAIYLSMIAVDQRYQNQGLGRILLADALERAASVADQVGIKVVVLDVIEDGGQEITRGRYAFYAAMGFQSLPSRPSRMFMSIDTIRRAMR